VILQITHIVSLIFGDDVEDDAVDNANDAE